MTDKRNWFKRHKWWTVFGVALIATVGISVFGAKKMEKKNYVTMDIMRGDISQTVTATGEIMPVNTVSVGSQVSGPILLWKVLSVAGFSVSRPWSSVRSQP